jgi:hypothetical protein
VAKYLHMKKMKHEKCPRLLCKERFFPLITIFPLVIFIGRRDDYGTSIMRVMKAFCLHFFLLPASKESSTQNPSATRVISSIHFVFEAEKWKMQATAASRTLSGEALTMMRFSSLPFDVVCDVTFCCKNHLYLHNNFLYSCCYLSKCKYSRLIRYSYFHSVKS